MAKHHKPVAGSRAYWPKKRARRIYPRINTRSVRASEPVPLAFAGYKAGMTRIVFTDQRKDSANEGQDIVKAVTVLDCPSLRVCAINVYRNTDSGLKRIGTVWAEKLSKDLDRKLKVPKKTGPGSGIQSLEGQVEKLSDVRLMVHTQPRESGIGKKKPEIFEISIGGDVQKKWEYAKGKLGGEIKVSDVLKEGEWVDVSAVDKGKGFQGPVKRFGITVRSRKNKGKRRHVGTMGPVTPGRVLPGKIAMAGQLGFQTRTEFGKAVMKIGSNGMNPRGGWLNYGAVKGDFILLSGSVPGPKKRLVMIRKGIRPKKPEHVEIKEIFLDSQQGV